MEFNSDDLTFSDPQPPTPERNPRIGERSIEQIFAHGQEDRIASKKVAAQLQYSSGAPNTRYNQTLWVRRFEAFRDATGRDKKRPYTGDDLIRFFDSILSKLKVVEGKPGVNRSTISNAVKILLGYGHFKWSERDGFKMTAHDASRFSVWLEKATREGRLTRGIWKKRTWIGYGVLSRLVRAYLTRGIEDGTLNWDVTISKCLSLVLISALGARSGDVVRAHLYTGDEYMQYRHVELYIEGNEPVFANLRARITVEFAKGHKHVMNDELIRYFRPLNEAHNSHMCPIALLLVHCLRHGLVAGRTLQEVLDRAFARTDRTVVWLFPRRPIIPAFGKGPLRCLLDKPASTNQVVHTIKELGVVAGMLDRAYGHALRIGAARDVAHLPSEEGTSLITENVRQSLGHKFGSLHRGVTENYTGGASGETYNARARAPAQTKGREPRFAAPKADGPDVQVRGQVRKMAAIENAREPDLEPRRQYFEMLDQPSPIPSPAYPGLSADTPGYGVKASKLLAQPSPGAASPLSRRPLAPKDPNVPSAHPGTAAPNVDPQLLQVIDPAILNDEELATLAEQIPAAAVEELQATALPTTAQSASETDLDATHTEGQLALDRFDAADAHAAFETIMADETAEEAAILFDAEDAAVNNALTTRPEEFVARYAKYNVYDNIMFARAWQATNNGDYDDTISNYCVVGGSREEPTPKVYLCRKTPGCPFKTIIRDLIRSHYEHCDKAKQQQVTETLEKISEAEFACTYKDCGFVPAPLSQRPSHALDDHVRSVHNFIPRACEHGCEPAKIYYEEPKYKYHLSSKHSGRWPAKCTFPDCTHEGTFTVHSALKYHLKTTHDLKDQNMGPFIPALAAKATFVANQECVFDGCSKQQKSRAAQMEHLRNTHRVSLEEAKAMMEERAEWEMVAQETKVGKKRAPLVKDVKKAFDSEGPAKKKAKK